jgi:ABC-type ATPase involved in cell division
MAAPGSVLYLSGESGVGKSSLISAYLRPELESAGWLIVQMRAFGDAIDRLLEELRSRRIFSLALLTPTPRYVHC